MTDLCFYFLSACIVVTALGVIGCSNTLSSAFCMIAFILSSAGLFLLLHAQFLAILHVLVYAGAVMVLFVFIIMLIGTDAPKARAKVSIRTCVGFFSCAVILGALWKVFLNYSPEMASCVKPASSGVPFSSSIKDLGALLLTKYMLPVQVTGFLLLMAMIGVVSISNAEPSSENASTSSESHTAKERLL